MTLCLHLRRWLCRWIAWLCPHAYSRILFINPLTGKPMSNLTLPNDAVAAIPVLFTDQVGRPIAGPAGAITASSSNDAIGTVTVGSDGASIDLTPVANGDFTVTVSAGSLSASLDVTVADPVAAAISIDVAHAVFSAKPAQAPTVAGS